ncbi:hypothetical protein F5Y06DRAFT_128700 [Hypoxylon sp. FL0890]|nr:hypothetical protein F5Y06DRAFT_128700 [Hypoxylon sp. FL0890]
MVYSYGYLFFDREGASRHPRRQYQNTLCIGWTYKSIAPQIWDLRLRGLLFFLSCLSFYVAKCRRGGIWKSTFFFFFFSLTNVGIRRRTATPITYLLLVLCTYSRRQQIPIQIGVRICTCYGL